MKSTKEIEVVALKARRELGMPSGALHETVLRKILENGDYYLFYYPFDENGISGAVINSVEAKVLIINSSKSLGRQNFTIAHEIGHIYLHDTENMIETAQNCSMTKEKEADKFASIFLMPDDEVASTIKSNGRIVFDVVEVMEISQMFRMSYKGTLSKLKEMYGSWSVPKYLWDKKPLYLAEMLNMDEKLYLPTKEKYWSTNKFVSIAFKALDKDKISFSKFLELVRDIGLDGYDVLENMKGKD